MAEHLVLVMDGRLRRARGLLRLEVETYMMRLSRRLRRLESLRRRKRRMARESCSDSVFFVVVVVVELSIELYTCAGCSVFGYVPID